MTTNQGTEVLGVIEKPSHIENPDATYKCRGMVWTSFNDSPPEWEPEKMRYLCYGTEVCPTSGKKHYQGYVYWLNPRGYRATCKKWKCWVRPSKGTPAQARAYCIKDGTYVEFGTLPQQGKRSDLDDLAQKILRGEKSVEDVLVEEPMTYHMYGRTLNALEDVAMRKKYRTEMTTCKWYVGPTGVGKSHAAFQGYSPETHYKVTLKDKGWWDGYRQQETVIINDFRGSIDYDELLNIIDKWPHSVPRRGREPMPFTSKNVIITSPMTPEEVYCRRHYKDDIAQLLRRIEVITLSAEEPRSANIN